MSITFDDWMKKAYPDHVPDSPAYKACQAAWNDSRQLTIAELFLFVCKRRKEAKVAVAEVKTLTAQDVLKLWSQMMIDLSETV